MVGSIQDDGSFKRSIYSSRGPTVDGRIKPDIASKGTSVWSTIPPYSYDHKTGTSMACPGIAGVMAQLYHAYKELNGGVNPPSALMKCILLNSADDIGNPGPDFKHGWGEVNAYRAVKMLESSNYISTDTKEKCIYDSLIYKNSLRTTYLKLLRMKIIVFFIFKLDN